jgi:hypothetical protein
MNNDELLEKIEKLIDAKLEPIQKDMQNLRAEMQAGFQVVKTELIQKIDDSQEDTIALSCVHFVISCAIKRRPNKRAGPRSRVSPRTLSVHGKCARAAFCAQHVANPFRASLPTTTSRHSIYQALAEAGRASRPTFLSIPTFSLL